MDMAPQFISTKQAIISKTSRSMIQVHQLGAQMYPL
jgi:hypothetical protein